MQTARVIVPDTPRLVCYARNFAALCLSRPPCGTHNFRFPPASGGS